MNTQSNATHTPLPWEMFPNYETGTCSIGHYGKSAPLVNHVCELPDIQSHDAEFIVRACNSHAQLVAAVKMVLDASEDCGDMNDIDWNMLRAALQSAKGE